MKAPFVPEDVREECRGLGAGGRAKLVVGAHDAVGISGLDGNLEGLEVDLAHGLLACPGHKAACIAAVRLLVVQGKVLEVAVDAVVLDAFDLCGHNLAGKLAVLGDILIVPAAEGAPVGVCTRCIEACDIESVGFLGEEAADFVGKLGVPRAAKDALARELGAGVACHDVVDAVRAIALHECRLVDALCAEGHPAAVADEHLLLIEGHLVEKLVPLGIVVVKSCHVRELEAVLRAVGDIFHIVVLDGSGVVERVLHLGRGLLGSRCHLRERACPVSAGEIRDAIAGRHVVELVCGCDLVGRALAVVCVVVDVVAIHMHGAGVDDVVGVRAQAHLVVACLEHVGAAFGLDALVVVAGHVLIRPAERDLLALAGVEELRLCKVAEHAGALLDAALRVGSGVVAFHDILAGNGAGVRDRDLHRDVRAIVGEVGDLLIERRVGEAVAERVLHGRGIVDVAILGCRLVVAVAHIDAFGVVHIVDVLGAGGCVSRACEEGLVRVLDVRVVMGAEVVVARCRGKRVGKGIGRTAGRIHGAGKHLADCIAARGAGGADPERCIDAVRVQEAELHSIRAVEDDNDLREVRLHHREEILLVRRELQVAPASLGSFVVCHVGRQVIALAALAGKHDERRVGVGLRVVDDILRVGRLGQLIEVPVGADEALALRGERVLVVEGLEVGVDLEACVLKALIERHVLRAVARAGARAAVAEVVAGRGAEDVHLLRAVERQRIVLVLEQDDAL